jgi:hypothetical protein
MKIVFLQQDFNGQQDKQNAQSNLKIGLLEKKAKLFKDFTKHDGVLQRIDQFDTRLQAIEDNVQA